MANRRMFAKTIVLSDAFLDMPLSARCLYFTLGMVADDDGFVGAPKAIMRQCGASQDDMLILLQKRYVLGFESGVIVIKHWKMNNYLQSDRKTRTTYIEELSQLDLDDKGAYTEKGKVLCNSEPCIQDVYTVKESIDKDSTVKRFVPPTVEEVQTYCQERKNTVDPERFVNYYESKGWMIGKNKMKDFKAAIRNWEKRDKAEPKKNKFDNFEGRSMNFEELERIAFEGD